MKTIRTSCTFLFCSFCASLVAASIAPAAGPINKPAKPALPAPAPKPAPTPQPTPKPAPVPTPTPQASTPIIVNQPTHMLQWTDAELLEEIGKRAFQFFWDQANDQTGLVSERASNRDERAGSATASITATGYALAALPIAVEHRWVTRQQAEARALTTLRFLANVIPQDHGFYFRLVRKDSGERAEKSELAPMDTASLIAGAIVCGEYFGGDSRKLAALLYARADWKWMLTNGGEQPEKRVMPLAFTPEEGFSRWGHANYSEAQLLLLLGMAAPDRAKALPTTVWPEVVRTPVEYAGLRTIGGGPLYAHLIPGLYFDLRGKRDRMGWDYAVAATNAVLINRRFCIDKAPTRKGYAENSWGLSASDSPTGFRVYGAPQGPEDGTVCPAAAIASMALAPEESTAVARAVYDRYGKYLWGRYGLGNAFSVDDKWFDSEVVAADLGMALIALENSRNSLIWKLMERNGLTDRAYKAAGLRDTREVEPRPLLMADEQEARSGKWITSETGEGAEKQLVIVYAVDGDYPQIGTLNLNTSALKLNYGPEGGWGAGIILMPSLWSGGKNLESGSVKVTSRTTGANLELNLKGQIGKLETSIKVVITPPYEKRLTAHVDVELRGEATLDKRPDAFKPVQLLFQHLSRDNWEARSAYAGTKTYEIPGDGWLLDPASGLQESDFGVLGGSSTQGTGMPTVRLQFEKLLTIAGKVDRVAAANTPNATLWGASDKLLRKYSYDVLVTSAEDLAGR